MLTMQSDARLAIESIKAGALGFLLKASGGEELLTALDAVLKGRTYPDVDPHEGGAELDVGPG